MTTYRQALIVGGAVVGQYVTSSSDQTPHFDYFYTDQIGSITEIADGAGALEAAYAYDPWGRRRDAVNWNSILPPSTIQSLNIPTRRGYTGAEMLDETGFVMLGARVYSPELGRWLSPDPAGMGSPYVYVSDNPESDTDPTGKFGILEAAEIVVGVALSCTGVGLAIVVAVAAAEGFVGGFIESGGNFRAGLMGAVSGAAFAAIGGAGIGNVFEKAALDGFAGGVLSEANGGRFSAGFIGGFVGGAASGEINAHIMSGDESAGAIAARTAAAAAAGGSASEISGGSFANGAYAAAFAQLFGDIAQREQANSQNDDAAPLSGDNEQGGATDNPGKGYDLNFLEKETTAWKYSQLHQNYPDRFDIIAHGCNDGQCIHTQRGDLFASKLEFRIQQSAVWQKEHQPIELDACFAGKGSYPIAQQIANYFHVKVYAPVSYGWIHSNGVYSASYGHTWGREAIFYPQSQE